MILHCSLSRDTSENGVSSRVEACRKRLRMVRGNQKASIKTVEPAGILDASSVEGGAEVSHSPEVIAGRAERMDEAEIT